MELRAIPVEDIYPDEKNPRKDFGDIAALAESCMLNVLNPGEPVNPIVVVQDGGIYRIVDGERRYKAMKKNKLIRCHAVVCEDMDEANVMVAMVATDDKQQLSEIERSRGVQQMMLLGVDPESVEKAGRIPKGSFAKLRRARVAVNDAGDDMTLDRMLTIAEFEEAGDDDAVKELANCKEGDWKWKADGLRRKSLERKNTAVVKGICESLAVPFYDEKEGELPDGYSYNGSFTMGGNFNEDNFLTELTDKASDERYEDIIVVLGDYWAYIKTKQTESETAPDSEEKARQQERDRTHILAKEDHNRRAIWIINNLHTATSTKMILEGLVESDEYLEYLDPSGFNNMYGTDVKVTMTPYVFALAEGDMDTISPYEWFDAVENPCKEEFGQNATFDLLTAMKIDGYEPSETEKAFLYAFAHAEEEE